MKITVVIVTHNPRPDLLRRTLAALWVQTFPIPDWELVVVDNASVSALTADVLDASPVAARLVREERLGIAFARFAGIDAARNEITVFVDDDNLLAPNYLASASAFLKAHPEVGALGGLIEPEFESMAPAWVLAHVDLLAVRDLGRQTIISDWNQGKRREFPWCSPYGAGLVSRTDCLRRYREYAESGNPISIGRVGLKKLAGSEDAEMILKGVLAAGLQVAYVPTLRVQHVIPAHRLKFAYLRRLAYETGVSWGEFCTRHCFMTTIPRWTVPLRQARAFVRLHAWSKSGFLSWATTAGRFAGRATRRHLS